MKIIVRNVRIDGSTLMRNAKKLAIIATLGIIRPNAHHAMEGTDSMSRGAVSSTKAKAKAISMQIPTAKSIMRIKNAHSAT